MNPIRKFFKTWNEAWLLLILLPLIPVVPYVLRLIDETAAPIDAGVYHTIFITALVFAFLHLFTWVAIYLNFGSIWDFFQTCFPEHFNNLTSWERFKFSCFILGLYLLAVVFTFSAVAGMA